MSLIERITDFRGEYEFLSNFYMSAPIQIDDITYPSSEHLYQAAKATDIHIWRHVASLKTAGQAKRYGKEKITLRSDWEEIKIVVMRVTLRLKFMQNPDLVPKLLATGDAELVEGNTWGDTYWGVCEGEGLNMLGKLLMELREKLKNEQKSSE